MSATPRPLDADALARRVRRQHRTLSRQAGGAALELYHRFARTIRVGVRDEREPIARQGDDEGIALRATSRDWDGLSFAAGSGASPATLRWTLAQSRRPASRSPCEPAWARGGGELMLDRDEPACPPPVDELRDWLERAREALASGGAGRPRTVELTVEVTATVESWCADGELWASRTRTRSWGLMRLREPWAGDRLGKPVLVARRRWQDLPVDGWRAALEDRRLPRLPEEPPPTAAVPVLFSPECSARLVLALIRNLSADETGERVAVGPAFRVTDDPGHPDALFGGSFDDGGFSTRRTRLADGRQLERTIGSAGNLRRPSFRDPPRPLPSQLVVAATDRGAPATGVLATALELHPLGPRRWLLQVEGARLESGRPVSVIRPGFVSISPRELVERCVSTVGPARVSHLGVETPALVFERLTLHD